MFQKKNEAFQDLIGKKITYEPIREWMKSWKLGIPSSNPAIIVGESGTGKTTIAIMTSEEAGFDPVFHDHENELSHTFINGRTPTFFGKKRVVILDDYHYTRAREWKIIEREIQNQSFPIIICVEHPKNVPWVIRRQAMMLNLERPSPEDLVRYLNQFPHDRSSEHIASIARSSSSWRTSLLTLLSTSESHEIVQTPRYPTRVGKAEIAAILEGHHPDHRFTNHPIAILTAAEYNHADPSQVTAANLLHSRSWEADNITRLSQAYLSTLRSKTSDSPPFRMRKITGSTRRV